MFIIIGYCDGMTFFLLLLVEFLLWDFFDNPTRCLRVVDFGQNRIEPVKKKLLTGLTYLCMNDILLAYHDVYGIVAQFERRSEIAKQYRKHGGVPAPEEPAAPAKAEESSH